ncbi:MAG: hypothetical protein AAF617_04940 [Bacteroidota bacterium]
MKKRYIIFTMLLWSCFQLYSQQKTVEEEYTAYFKLPREALHVHLNKTTFFKGEEIWFKGYAYDQRNQLVSKATTNINVGIYDATGKQVKKALFAAENGMTYGNFAIDSTFTAGTYYVKAETNWMKNFKEDNAFIQKIEIVTSETINREKKTEKAQFDFQFLPEGGHIVADTKNNIGFKIVNNNGKGVMASGIVFDQDKKQVAYFESKTLGMGKFLFQPQKDKQYTAEITVENGATITKNLPTAEAQGVSLMMKIAPDGNIILQFNTNEQTLANYPNKTYKILIHQSGKLKTAALKFRDIQKSVSIEKERLFKGINTITVFDEEQHPILERLFFNDFGMNNTNINVAKLNKIQDSIIVSVKALNLTKNANVSISVLPEATESYNPTHNILSSFYLKPHIKGAVENPQYYFQNMDRKKKYELDILLLTQGWSRYDWNDIFGVKPKATYRFENGITISGRVNKPASGVEKLFLYATKNHNSKIIELDENQGFEFTGLFLEEDEELKFSYLSENGPMRKPGMYVRFITPHKEDKLSEAYLENTSHIKYITTDFTVPKDFFYKDVEKLDTVNLKAEKKKPKYNPFFMVNPVVNEVTMEEYVRYNNIVEYLNIVGFDASQDFAGNVYINSRVATKRPPRVFFNDVPLNSFNILYNMSLAEVESVVVDKFSIAPSTEKSTQGVIKIYSRLTPLFKKEKTEVPYLKASAPVAFAKQKEYYSPKYSSYLNPIFQKYGAISWVPSVVLNTETATTFKIYNTYTKNVTICIEGIAENGDLISERKTITVR